MRPLRRLVGCFLTLLAAGLFARKGLKWAGAKGRTGHQRMISFGRATRRGAS